MVGRVGPSRDSVARDDLEWLGLCGAGCVVAGLEGAAFDFVGSAPHSVGFAVDEGVGAAIELDRAQFTDSLGDTFAADSCSTALVFAREEQVGVEVPTPCIKLPVPIACEWLG